MIHPKKIHEIADSLLAAPIGPSLKHRLLRDVLGLPEDDPRLVDAHRDLLRSGWVQKILAQQQDDGGWGYFHSLSSAQKGRWTTEQALRRLLALGLSPADAPIKKAIRYLERALEGKIVPPDRAEVTHRWDIYMPLMLAAWLRYLVPGHPGAMAVARRWGRIISHAFSGDGYDQGRYLEAYREEFSEMPHPKAGRLRDFVRFYCLRILNGGLPPAIEEKMLAYVIGHPTGIYYICEGPLTELPADFCSRRAVRYISALELLTEYPRARGMLAFAADWLAGQRDADGRWDMGPAAKDNIHLPLSDSWRSKDARRTDCTVRVLSLLSRFQ